MALRTLHLCQFQFKDQDIRRVGASVDGGTSLSGISDPIEADGGGYWRGDWTNGSSRDATGGLAWRQVVDVLTGGVVAVNVLLCERLFQPTFAATHLPPQPTPFSDGTELVTSGSYTGSAAALRATSIKIASGPYAQPISPGMLFSIQHPSWGWHAYRIQDLASDGTATIRPPLREAVTAGTFLEFDWPRCQMHLAVGFQVSNATNIGRYMNGLSLSFVEDMRKPS